MCRSRFDKHGWEGKRGKGMIGMFFGGMVMMLLMPLLVKILWNALLPELFGAPMIGYFQALGLLILSRLLFGGGSRGHYRRGRWKAKKGEWKRRFREKMDKMSPEERAKFKESFMGRGWKVNIWEVEEEEEETENPTEENGKDEQE